MLVEATSLALFLDYCIAHPETNDYKVTLRYFSRKMSLTCSRFWYLATPTDKGDLR